MNRLASEILDELRYEYDSDIERAEAIYDLCKEAFVSDLKDEIREEVMKQIEAEAVSTLTKLTNLENQNRIDADMIREAVSKLKSPKLNPNAGFGLNAYSRDDVLAYLNAAKTSEPTELDALGRTLMHFAPHKQFTAQTSNTVSRNTTNSPLHSYSGNTGAYGSLGIDTQMRVNCGRCLKNQAYPVDLTLPVDILAVYILIDRGCC